MKSQKILNSTAIIVVAALMLAGPASAEDDISERRHISVSGLGEASGSPDQATINAGVQTVAVTAVEAAKENQAAVAKVMQALASSGIDKKDIQTSNYSIWPEQRHDPRGNNETMISGYRVNNTVSVVVRDLDRLPELLAAATNAGANSIGGIDFAVKDPAALEQKARAAAMADARKKAEDLARLGNVQLGEVLQISMLGGADRPMYSTGARLALADAAPAPSISAGQLSVTVQVHVLYAIR
jgi:uncharacterized protein YggE